jgi:hypothetical protein
MIFWVVMLCVLVGGYQHFRRMYTSTHITFFIYRVKFVTALKMGASHTEFLKCICCLSLYIFVVVALWIVVFCKFYIASLLLHFYKHSLKLQKNVMKRTIKWDLSRSTLTKITICNTLQDACTFNPMGHVEAEKQITEKDISKQPRKWLLGFWQGNNFHC